MFILLIPLAISWDCSQNIIEIYEMIINVYFVILFANQLSLFKHFNFIYIVLNNNVLIQYFPFIINLLLTIVMRSLWLILIKCLYYLRKLNNHTN